MTLISLVFPIVTVFVSFYYFDSITATILSVLAIIISLVYNAPSLLMIRGAAIYRRFPAKGVKYMGMANNMSWLKKEYVVYYSYVCLREGMFAESEKVIAKVDSFKNLAPDQKLRSELNKALLYWKTDRLDSAIEVLQALHNDGVSKEIYGNLGYFLIQKGDLKKALDYNLEAYEYNSDDPSIIDNLGLTYYKMGDIKKSREIYEQLYSKTITAPVIYYNFAKVMLESGENEQAKELLLKAIEMPFTHLAAVTKKEVRELLDKA